MRNPPGAIGKVGLRKDFWEHMGAARERLAERHPEKSKREILAMAREESLGHDPPCSFGCVRL